MPSHSRMPTPGGLGGQLGKLTLGLSRGIFGALLMASSAFAQGSDQASAPAPSAIPSPTSTTSASPPNEKARPLSKPRLQVKLRPSYMRRKFTSMLACTGTGCPSRVPGLKRHSAIACAAFSSKP